MGAILNKFLASSLLLGVLLLAMLLAGTTAAPFCNIDSKELGVCRLSVAPPHGQPLQPPTEGCCSVVRRADLKCMCNLKSTLPSIGINPANALALPSKCGIQTPSECHGP